MLLLDMVVHLDVVDCETESVGAASRKNVVFVSDVDVFDVVLDAPEQPGDETHERRLPEFEILLLLLLQFLLLSCPLGRIRPFELLVLFFLHLDFAASFGSVVSAGLLFLFALGLLPIDFRLSQLGY